MRKIDFKNVVWKEGKYYVSWNLNTGISSFGDNKKEVPHGTFQSILLQSGLKESDFRDEKK